MELARITLSHERPPIEKETAAGWQRGLRAGEHQRGCLVQLAKEVSREGRKEGRR